MALIIKTEIENEFGGFVDVFVSSDGVSIPAGANFLKRIEDGLSTCVGALYLISPISVKRSWISFELGAVWIRNVASARANGSEIPTLPVCHSGMTPAALPIPLNNLNAIVGNQAAQLSLAFKSLQSAVGGRGALKTDFDALAAKVAAFERSYTVGTNLKKVFSGPGDIAGLIARCERAPRGTKIHIIYDDVEDSKVKLIKQLEADDLRGLIQAKVLSVSQGMGSHGVVSTAKLELLVGVDLLLQCKDQLLAP